jgi:hypothetical protein
VLFPVRFLYTAATGRVGTNDAAAAWYLTDQKSPGSKLVAAALEWRTIAPTDETNTALLLHEHMLPLYLRYIEDHIARLQGLEDAELARAFQEWRHRLTR